jgi:hypothetical protein
MLFNSIPSFFYFKANFDFMHVHPWKICVNNYGKLRPLYDNLHEYILLLFNPYATANICCDCDYWIDKYWNCFYKIHVN